jgi:alkylation response protein AidB-like acyl-CoA dehydrogenase
VRVAVETFKSEVRATRTALAVTNKIFEVTGARATASKDGFDLYWRNVRTHTSDAPVLYRARDRRILSVEASARVHVLQEHKQ